MLNSSKSWGGPPIEIDANADYLFECFAMLTNRSTNIYLEATLTTLTQDESSVTSGWNAEYFHQYNRSIPTSYILIDN